MRSELRWGEGSTRPAFLRDDAKVHPELPPLVKNPQLRVGDRWISTGKTFAVNNPATGEQIAQVPLGEISLMSEANRAAHAAFELSRHEPAWVRSEMVARIAAEIHKRADSFVALIVAEAGKPVTLARAEVQRALATFTLAAELARQPTGATLELEAMEAGNGHHGVLRRFPLGVIAAVTPFNFPLNLVAHKVAPALAAGNTIVLKPSPRAPLTSLLLAEAIAAAGVPPGRFNVVTCGNELVSHWLEDPLIRMLSFTGSAPVGRALHRHVAGRRCALELGGNAGVIVYKDANVEHAIPMIARAAFSFAGQSCISVQRVLVHESVYERVREGLLNYTRDFIVAGDPEDAGVLLGPMISEAAAEGLLRYVDAATTRGARVLCGGTRRGAFVQPTIVEGASPDDDLVREEMFAPVLSLESFADIEAAFLAVNHSAYGLQTGFFTNDFSLAWRAFQELEVGAVLINEVPTWRVENMPYGGVKNSGLGREGVASAMEEMTEPRAWIWRTL
jgi:glyceraldehyde-3-phosphate dehydrogenase (NADP+)